LAQGLVIATENHITLRTLAAMTDSAPISPIKRQVSEPGVDSEKLPDLARSQSEPSLGIFASEQLGACWQKAKVLKNRMRRRSSKTTLVQSLRQGARTENNKPPWALIAAIVVFNVIGKIGDAVGPAMVGSKPLQLLLLNASNTHCILTTTTVHFLPWILVAVGRRFCEDPLYFFAGWRYREACLGMLRTYSPNMADGIDKAEELFKKNLYVAVALNPGATVCSLAGASKMPPVAFFSLNVGSTAGQLLIIKYVCLQFPSRIDEVLGFISKYMIAFLALMVGITLIGALPTFRMKKHTD